MIFTIMALTGCGANQAKINLHSKSWVQDIFQEMPDGGKPPRGYADLVIKASLKTHLKGYFLLEPRGSRHGEPFNTFMINIDGQAKTYEVKGKEERGPQFDDQGKESPEVGLGMQYAFEQKLRLKAGNHRLFFGIPGEEYSKEINLTLEEGETYLLHFKPNYRCYRSGRAAFELGVCGYTAFLNKI
jgi:hypothetical protein